MKEKIIIFAIGLLVGAVLTTGAFLVFSKSSKCDMDKDRQMHMKMDYDKRMQDRDQRNMPGNNMMPNNPNGNNNQNGQQPEMPNGNQQQNNNN